MRRGEWLKRQPRSNARCEPQGRTLAIAGRVRAFGAFVRREKPPQVSERRDVGCAIGSRRSLTSPSRPSWSPASSVSCWRDRAARAFAEPVSASGIPRHEVRALTSDSGVPRTRRVQRCGRRRSVFEVGRRVSELSGKVGVFDVSSVTVLSRWSRARHCVLSTSGSSRASVGALLPAMRSSCDTWPHARRIRRGGHDENVMWCTRISTSKPGSGCATIWARTTPMQLIGRVVFDWLDTNSSQP
jgi:hypothetical protein